ncbi:unnamed protein product [Phytophthora fragariaefolia]|uniref:Unnamed protein product n=1 Tax=Phytophthora fragariaefolia TaxID=1490495 RepID=A0A9W6YPB7_9STRA|nr:unnamed protein product [Phytophthora fragariaefolia]
MPKDGVVVTTHDVKNTDTLGKEQNLQVQRFYLRNETSQDAETPENEVQASIAEGTSSRSKKKRASTKQKKQPWARERHVTHSVAENARGVANEATQPQESARDIASPSASRDAMFSKLKYMLFATMAKELQALEDNGVWRVVRKPKDAHPSTVSVSTSPRWSQRAPSNG